MKFSLHAGAELDLLTKGELVDALTDNREEEMQIWRGVKYRSIPFSATSLPYTFDPVPDGHSWSVKRISIVFNAADKATAYEGRVSDGSLVGYDATSDTRHVLTFGSNSFVATNQIILINGTGTAVSAVGLLKVEQVPAGDEWKL